MAVLRICLQLHEPAYDFFEAKSFMKFASDCAPSTGIAL
jgi:hypothetical protein